MASDQPHDITAPITPARFAAALKDLSVASLHLKTLEIRNSLAHLAYSNAQLRPFADGTQAALGGGGSSSGQPDPDCVDAIRENEAVMERMRERVGLVRAEVEGRGLSWREFEAKDEVEDDEPGVTAAAAPAPAAAAVPAANGVNGHAESGAASSRGNPWEDGTFQTGVIRNGEIHMDAAPRQGSSTASRQTNGGGGGSLTDEELRRRLEERLAEDNDEEDGGLHL
ncbi:hypothetical protein N8I77_004580 [Diaporthe amygdali]|uniref:Translation machinery-associated protein 17 n=1 Tax=Phomopsis amygdali TaxID=1214568 RepID=A0AAD9W618_PHOAM|nr:hypothetical protein N8I77_004580 [Diaporthe amygdali]